MILCKLTLLNGDVTYHEVAQLDAVHPTMDGKIEFVRGHINEEGEYEEGDLLREPAGLMQLVNEENVMNAKQIAAQFTEKDDLLADAWAIIAIAICRRGVWELANDDWRKAAERWRDRWHKNIDGG